MLQVYLFSFVVGAILLGASLFLGDSDLDGGVDVGVDADLDVDVGADIDAGLDHDFDAGGGSEGLGSTGGHEGLNWLLFLRVRFLIFASTFFGLTGLLLMIFKVFDGTGIGLVFAIVTGIVAGFAADRIVDKLKREDTGRVVGETSYIGLHGKVILSISPTKRGVVHLLVQGTSVELPARPFGDESLAVGEEVIVKQIENAVLLVARHPVAAK